MTYPVRLYALDYLRGLSAAGIIVFHFVLFTYGAPNTHSAPVRWGASMILMTMSFYALTKPSGFIHVVQHSLGVASFSVYMLHNIVWVVLTGFAKFSGLTIEGISKILLAITIIISASYVAYRFFEKRCIRVGQLFNQRYIG